MEDKTVPSEVTASIPRTDSLVIPYLMTLLPPAFVEMLPPIEQDPLAPKSRGKIIFSDSAFSCMVCKVTPD